MQDKKNYKPIYTAASVAGIALSLAAAVLIDASYRSHDLISLAVILTQAALIAVPITAFIRILCQTKIPVKFSRITNTVFLVIFAVGIAVYYCAVGVSAAVGFYSVILNHPWLIFLFLQHLASLVYDLCFRQAHT